MASHSGMLVETVMSSCCFLCAVGSCIVAGDGFEVAHLPRRVLVVQVDKHSLISNSASIPRLQNSTVRVNLH